MDELLKIMSLLRDKEYGCPWDLKQTHRTLARYTLEEVYEVIDAIERGTVEQLKDELGDLLFQVVFYAQIADEARQFNFDDVVAAISDKLLRRHPHVFPHADIENFGQKQNWSADDVVVSWEAIKEQERKNKGEDEPSVNKEPNRGSTLDDIPLALPALERALKIQKRVAVVGFDWQNTDDVINKLKEELAEVEQALGDKDAVAIEAELGDLLFSIVNLARHCKVEPENALRAANRKFENRFHFIEEQLALEETKPEVAGFARLDQLWDQAKQEGL